ncbi:ARD/ARD' family domain-containing protein [Ditylenchus destructor]|nr:ARD/ARD' family domain-containing protein [Ditylenchus destructor]
MVQIWCMETYPCGDPRLPHHCFPPKTLNPDELTKKTVLKLERNFKREDTYTLDSQSTIDFQDKLQELFEETESTEDQARMILEGSAYYDVEATDGSWIRIMCEDGDLIVIPAGKTYRMTTTNKNFVKMRRFYKDDEN